VPFESRVEGGGLRVERKGGGVEAGRCIRVAAAGAKADAGRFG